MVDTERVSRPSPVESVVGPVPGERLLALVRGGRWWDVLAESTRLLEAAPVGVGGDVRAIAMIAATRLGLRTAALEHAQALDPASRAQPEIGGLIEEAVGLPADGVSTDELAANLSKNLDALARRGIDLRDRVEEWLERARRLEVFRATCGNLVWRRLAGAWLSLADHRGAAQAVPLPFLNERGEPDPAKPPKPIIVEGADPPWLLERVYDRTPAMPDGYRPAIHLVQEEPAALIDALSAVDLTRVLRDERVRLHVGPGASAALRSLLASRLAYALPGEYLLTPGTRTLASPGLVQLVRELQAAQQAEHVRLSERVTRAYQGKDAAFWRARFEDARNGGEPLRVLLPVSRYSTFVRHSAADLAEALAALGCDARVLSEPDDSSKLVTLAYLEQFDTWRPDCVVLINFARRHMKDAVPAEVPFVCWVQDRMQQLFDGAVGASMGPLDFVVGHLHTELFSLFNWPRARRLFAFVPASSKKFHTGPLAVGEAERLACDVAYVSHQSEPPEKTHARLRLGFANHAGILRAVDRLYERLLAEPEVDHVRETLPALVREAGFASPDPRLLSTIEGNYLTPIAERLLRHRTLEWAASAADRIGCSLRIFGKGWAEHPTLGRFAGGPLEHGEALRTLYRSAKVNLHMARSTSAHQRVYECALSEGLMVRRGPSPDARLAPWALLSWLMRHRPATHRSKWGDLFYDLVEGEWPDPRDFPSVELPHRAGVWMTVFEDARGRRIHKLWTDRWWHDWMEANVPAPPLEMLPDYSMPFARETMFMDAGELEGLIGRALGEPEWRAEVVAAQGAWARSTATSDAMGRRVLELISRELGAQIREKVG